MVEGGRQPPPAQTVVGSRQRMIILSWTTIAHIFGSGIELSVMSSVGESSGLCLAVAAVATVALSFERGIYLDVG